MTLSGWLGYHRYVFPAVFQHVRVLLLDAVGRGCLQKPAVPCWVQYHLQISSEGQYSSTPVTCILSSDLFFMYIFDKCFS